MEFILKDYLGDGVYALFDGLAIWLRANDMNDPTDEICLEPNVIDAFYRFNKHCNSLIKEIQSKQKGSSC